MVKRIIGGLCLALALTSCNGNKGKVNGNGYLINGEISDIRSGMVYLKEYQDKNYTLVDSA